MIDACEMWIDACEMWIWRRMLRVAWTEKRTNESILQELGELRGGLSLLQKATRQKMSFRARNEGGERDDVGVRRGEDKERTAKEEVHEGDRPTGGNGDGPGAAERSVDEP